MFPDFKSNTESITLLTNMIKNNNMKNLIINGASGSGKTTLSLLFAKKYNPDGVKILTNESNGLVNIKKEMLNFIKTRTMFDTRKKILIIDNIDNLKLDIQYYIYYLINKYNKNTVFIFNTNNIDCIYKSICNNCINIKLYKISFNDIKTMFETSGVSNNKLKKIYNKTKGDIRKISFVLNDIKNIHIEEEIKKKLLSNCEIEKKHEYLLDVLYNNFQIEDLFEIITRILLEQKRFDDIIKLSEWEESLNGDYNLDLLLYSFIMLFN
jgi:DNA polymerase III delta prime subunit